MIFDQKIFQLQFIFFIFYFFSLAVSFSLGVLYSNWAYDYFTLWQRPSIPEAFELSLNHYKQWGSLPSFLYHVHHAIAGLGFIGLFLKLYKPSESNKLFDGASLFLYMVGFVIYLTNLRIGVGSAVSGEWGEVDMFTGINVIAASEVMIVFTFLGVLGLQVGQYWAEHEDKRVYLQAMEEERKEQEEQEQELEKEQEQEQEQKKQDDKSTSSAKTSGASVTSTKSKKTK